MQVIRSNNPEAISDATAVALGMFDGVHLGHKSIINATIDHAKKHNLKSAVITLANHPRLFIQGKAPAVLTDLDSKLKIFERLGVNYVLLLNFNEEIREMDPAEYLERYLVRTLNSEFISIGYNHHFGKDRAGGPEYLEEWCSKNSTELFVCGPVSATQPDEVVSSSRIREYIEEGNICAANALLGHEYFIRGHVIHGDDIGKKLGFPTANLKTEKDIAHPGFGVYAGKCKVLGEEDKSDNGDFSPAENNYMDCVINVGVKPTFHDKHKESIEIHIMDFTGDLYEKELELVFVKRLRDEQKFPSPEALVDQINKDIEDAQSILAV